MVIPSLSQQQNAIDQARQLIDRRPLFLDTETTGLGRTDEIIEISILESDGAEIFSSLVKPSRPIPEKARRIHGISNIDVSKAQIWPVIWTEIRNIFSGRVIVAYNASFDQRMMEQSYTNYRLSWREKLIFSDVMALFSQFRGEWNPERNSYRLFSLEQAGTYFQIPLPNSHRSSEDALLTRAVLHSIAGIPY